MTASFHVLSSSLFAMIQSFDAIQFALLQASLNKRLTNSDIPHLEELPKCNGCRQMLWKFVENCGFPVVEGPTPSSRGSQLEQASTTELYRSERWARPTTQPAARGSNPAHRILVITCSRTMVLRAPQSNNQQQNKKAKPVDKKLWIHFLITGDWSNFFTHIVIHFTTH